MWLKDDNKTLSSQIHKEKYFLLNQLAVLYVKVLYVHPTIFSPMAGLYFLLIFFFYV